MKKYLGVKIVSAEPMTQADAFELGLVKTNYPGSPAGYKVVYEDDYASWSPKEVFEKAYRDLGEVSFTAKLGGSLDVVVFDDGSWDFSENQIPPQPEYPSRIDMLKQFALSQAVKYTVLLPSPSASGVIAASNVFFEYLAE